MYDSQWFWKNKGDHALTGPVYSPIGATARHSERMLEEHITEHTI